MVWLFPDLESRNNAPTAASHTEPWLKVRTRCGPFRSPMLAQMQEDVAVSPNGEARNCRIGLSLASRPSPPAGARGGSQ